MKLANLRRKAFKLAHANNCRIAYHKYWYTEGGFFTLTPLSHVSSSRVFVDYGRTTTKEIIRYIQVIHSVK